MCERGTLCLLRQAGLAEWKEGERGNLTSGSQYRNYNWNVNCKGGDTLSHVTLGCYMFESPLSSYSTLLDVELETPKINEWM